MKRIQIKATSRVQRDGGSGDDEPEDLLGELRQLADRSTTAAARSAAGLARIEAVLGTDSTH